MLPHYCTSINRSTRAPSAHAPRSRWRPYAVPALGMDRVIGSLEPRKRADLITVSMAGAR